MKDRIARAKVHIELTHRGWRFSLLLGANDTLSMLSYKTEKEAIFAAETQREMLLEMFF